MLAEHGYARFATVCDTYVDSTFSSRAMIDSSLDTLSTDRNWSICETFQIYRMYEQSLLVLCLGVPPAAYPSIV